MCSRLHGRAKLTIQREGYAPASQSIRIVIRAHRPGRYGRIAVTDVRVGRDNSIREVLDWNALWRTAQMPINCRQLLVLKPVRLAPNIRFPGADNALLLKLLG